jgi:hypothetical protein
MYNKWNECINLYTENTFICNDIVEIDSNNMYLATTLIKESFFEYYNIDLPDYIKTPKDFYKYLLIEQKINDYRMIDSISELSSGMIVFISNSESDSQIINTGIIHEVGKDYIRVVQANSSEINNYYTLNFNGRNITAANFNGEFIQAFGKIK